jgi:hypothetical protein
MKTRTTRTQRLHEGKTTTGPTRWTRLSKDSDHDVQNLVTADYPIANVIRDLVDEALHVRHLNKAGRHPAVRELLRTFDEIVNDRVDPLRHQVAELQAQLTQTNRFLATLFISITQNFEFVAEGRNEKLDQLLFTACADEANAMAALILKPHIQPNVNPTEQSQSTLRPIVARELNDDPVP